MAVVGVGGVGSVAAEMLTRCGIGKVVSNCAYSVRGLWLWACQVQEWILIVDIALSWCVCVVCS